MLAPRYVGWTIFIFACTFALGCNSGTDSDTSEPSPNPASRGSVKSAWSRLDEPPIISITAIAKARLDEVVAGQGLTGPCYLRLRVLPGGCMGFQHKLDLDSAASFEDYTFESSGMKVVVLKRQVDMLRGVEVDFGFDGDKQGFKIKNPNFEGEALKKWLPVLEKDKRAT